LLFYRANGELHGTSYKTSLQHSTALVGLKNGPQPVGSDRRLGRGTNPNIATGRLRWGSFGTPTYPTERWYRHDKMRLMETDRFKTAEALGKARQQGHWKLLHIDTKNPLTNRTVAILQGQHHISEVAEFLAKFYANPEHIDSRLWHYLKRKYEDDVPLTEPEAIDRLFEQVLSDPEATVYRPGERYHLVSSDLRWIAVVDPAGVRISLMIARNLQRLGKALWKLRDLSS